MRLWGENGVQSTSQHLAGHPKKRWLGMTEVQLTASGGSSSTRHPFAPSAPPVTLAFWKELETGSGGRSRYEEQRCPFHFPHALRSARG